MRTINIMKENKTLIEIRILDYFKVGKTEYVLYEHDTQTEDKRVYLSKLDGHILANIDKSAVENMQTVIKTLLSNEKSKKDLNKLHYKKLNDNTLIEGIEERGSITISLNDEQYQNLLSEPKVIEKKKNNILLYVLVLLVIAAIAVVGYIYLNRDKKEEEDKPQNYTITFVTNSPKQIGAVNVENGKTIDLTKTIPERDGFSFVGWYVDANFTTPADQNYMPKENVTLYARWKEIVNCKDCEVGKTVTLTDNSKWIVIDNKEDSPTITLLAETCFGEFIFDTSDECTQGNCTNDYSSSNIRHYLEGEYLKGVASIRPFIKEVRLATVDEIRPLLEMEKANEWLFNKNVWDGNWWTMTPVGSNQYYSVTVDGKIEPSNEEDKETGTADLHYGVRPVIVIDKSAITQPVVPPENNQ